MRFFFGRRTRTRPAILFPKTDCSSPVNDWAKEIQALPENSQCRVRKIVHYRDPTATQHEFLLVYIHHPVGKNAILMVEREMGSYGSYGTDTSGMHPSLASISFPPCDEVKLSYDGTHKCLTRDFPFLDKLYTVSFKNSTSPSVAQFAALLNVVSQYGSQSRSFSSKQDGSWFAHTIAQTMKTLFRGVMKENAKCMKASRRCDGMQIGHWDAGTILVKEYEMVWAQFFREMAMMHNQWLNDQAMKRKQEMLVELAAEEQKLADKEALASMLRSMNY